MFAFVKTSPIYKDRFSDNQIRFATTRTIKETGNKVRTALVKGVTEEFNVKKSDFNDHVKVTQKPSNKNPTYQLTGRSKRPGLEKFKRGRQKNGVLAVQIKKNGEVKKVRGVFQLPNNDKAFFKRNGHKRVMTKGSYQGKVREEVERLTAISPTAMMRSVKNPIVPSTVRKTWASRFRHNLDFYRKRDEQKLNRKKVTKG